MRNHIELRNDKVLLRPYRSSDARAVYEAAIESVEQAGKWLPWCHPGYTLKESKDWIKICSKAWKEGTAYEFGVFDAQTGQFLGGCGLNHIDPTYKTANLGYWVRSSQNGKGIAPAAAALAARFGIEEAKLNRIEIIAAVENTRSQRAAEKAGAKREGILMGRIPLEDGAHDAAVFSFVSKDFAAESKSQKDSLSDTSLIPNGTGGWKATPQRSGSPLR
jgi:ribosomal-protein-serine acetyltransferase